MKRVQVLAAVGLIGLAAAIGYALMSGDFAHEGGRLLNMPWGIVTLVDLYLGFLLFAFWMGFRERSPWHALPWIVSLLVLGNLVACVYVLAAVRSSGGAWQRFWLGDRGNGV